MKHLQSKMSESHRMDCSEFNACGPINAHHQIYTGNLNDISMFVFIYFGFSFISRVQKQNEILRERDRKRAGKKRELH